MKRFIAGLTFALTLTATAHAQEYQTVSQLRESVPARWTTKVETKWRDVDIDAEIVTPDVETIPVMKVGYDLHHALLTPEESGWDEVDDTYDVNGLILCQDADKGKPPRKIDGKKVGNGKVTGIWHDISEPDRAYIPMCDVTYSEMIDMIRAELTRFGYPPEDFNFTTPNRIQLTQWYFAGTTENAAPGYLIMDFYPKLNGITIYAHILDVVRNTRGERRREDGFRDNLRTSTCYDGIMGCMSDLCIRHLLPIETMAEDVPLCSFDMIQKSLEQEIKKGRVRKIYEISLGYVLYCVPGAYHEWGQNADYSSIFYDVKPMWRVNCLQASSAQAALEEFYENDERNSLAYTQMLVDAQTGEIIGQSDAADRSMFPGFLTWDDVNR